MKIKNNFIGYAERYMGFNSIQQYKVGDIITHMVHWSDGNGALYETSDHKQYNYCFQCSKLEGHKINYDIMNEDDEDFNSEYYEFMSTNYGANYNFADETEIIVDNDDEFEVVEIDKRDDENDAITYKDFEDDEYPVLVIHVKRITKISKEYINYRQSDVK